MQQVSQFPTQQEVVYGCCPKLYCEESTIETLLYALKSIHQNREIMDTEIKYSRKITKIEASDKGKV